MKDTPEIKETDFIPASAFVIKPMNDFIEDAKLMPAPVPLWREFWTQGELSIFFGDTGIGKSVLAFQIADELSKSRKLIYFDFEMGEKQLEKRYSDDYRDHYQFSPNFLRAIIGTESYLDSGFKTPEEFINRSLEMEIERHKPQIIFIDNITFMSDDTETGKRVMPLMKCLDRLKKEYKISIMVLGHTPKRKWDTPLGLNDLSGSKNFSNFCDAVIAFGRSSKGRDIRYLKQLKARSAPIIYDHENVWLLKLNDQGNFLRFDDVHPVHAVHSINEHEHEHLKHYSQTEHEGFITKTIELSKRGMSQRKISAATGFSTGKVNGILQKYKNEHNGQDEHFEQNEHDEQE
jgi:hypothetical protein